MKFLVIDHFFGQDIEALHHVAGKYEFRVVSQVLLPRIARKYFPATVFSSLLGEAYASPEYADERRRYAIEARKFLHSLYYTFPFDAVIVPSDTIFYLRALSSAAHEMGIPFIVLQKETAISPYTMTEDARIIGKSLSFIGDIMLVCSDNHKQFWLNTGAKAEKIIVTGQPRFDFYHYPERWKTLHSLGVHFSQTRPIVFFLSYDVGAYSPEGVLSPTWTQLRDETEVVLINAAKQGYINLLIKPHPQQQGIIENQERLRKMAGDMWGKTVQWLSGTFDTRHLIVNAQIVVGFQTTALFEAMAAAKTVIYTFWTESISRFIKAILPFHEMGNAILVSRSPKELENYLLSHRDVKFTDAQKQKQRYEAEKQMGPLDGQAAIRSWKEITAFTKDYLRQADPKAVEFRHSLDAMAPAYCRRLLIRAKAAIVIWRIAEWLLPIGYPILQFIRCLRDRSNLVERTYEDYLERITMQRRNAMETVIYIRSFLRVKFKRASKKTL